jgi:hypothetical protein
VPDVDRQDAVLQRGGDVLGLDLGRQREPAAEAAREHLAAQVAALLRPLVLGAPGADRQHALLQGHLDVLRLEAGERGLDPVAVVGPLHVQRRAERWRRERLGGGEQVRQRRVGKGAPACEHHLRFSS